MKIADYAKRLRETTVSINGRDETVRLVPGETMKTVKRWHPSPPLASNQTADDPAYQQLAKEWYETIYAVELMIAIGADFGPEGSESAARYRAVGVFDPAAGRDAGKRWIAAAVKFVAEMPQQDLDAISAAYQSLLDPVRGALGKSSATTPASSPGSETSSSSD